MQARNLLSYNTDLLEWDVNNILSLYRLIMVKNFITGHVIQEKWPDSEQQLIHMNVSIINILIVYKDQPTFFWSRVQACSL